MTFAVLLGVVCDDMSIFIENIRTGNYAVVESGHTLVLNWNQQTVPMLRQVRCCLTLLPHVVEYAYLLQPSRLHHIFCRASPPV